MHDRILVGASGFSRTAIAYALRAAGQADDTEVVPPEIIYRRLVIDGQNDVIDTFSRVHLIP